MHGTAGDGGLKPDALARNLIGSGGIDRVAINGVRMTEAQLMTELAESCRRLACYQRNPDVLDMLHDLEEDFTERAGKRETETSGQKSSFPPSSVYKD
jgi:nucleoside diphosphate kinase